jgi:hypothetical protein
MISKGWYLVFYTKLIFLTISFDFVSNTVADVEGFDEWSSGREPCQVFTLLETLYSAFDKIADQRRIYKVETVGTMDKRIYSFNFSVCLSHSCCFNLSWMLGESYVAVCGMLRESVKCSKIKIRWVAPNLVIIFSFYPSRTSTTA